MANPLATLSACIVFTGIIGVSTAEAVDLNLRASAGFDVTAGLDDKTRTLIENLPKEIHDQVVKLLQDALPLIDTSVLTYLNRVNEILDTQINHLQCAADGVIKSLGGTVRETIGIKPTPVADLKQDESSTVTSLFYVKDEPEMYEIKYSDFRYRAAVTWCSAEISPDTSATIAKLQAEIRPRWRIWYRLDAICSDAANCYDILSARVSTKTNTSDPRDVDNVSARQRFAQVTKPAIPNGAGKYDPTQYETALGALLSIGDSLEIARLARKSLATAAWGAAVAAKPAMNSLLGTEMTELHGPANIIDYNNALQCDLPPTGTICIPKGRLVDIITQITNINNAAKYAAQLDDLFNGRYQELKAELQSNLNSTYALYTQAAGVLNRLQGMMRARPVHQYPPQLPPLQL